MKHPLSLYMIVTLSALGGLLFGYDTGVISGAILFIRHDFNLSSSQVEIVISSVLLGAIVGSACAGFLSDQLGRWRLLFFTACLFTIASVASAFAPQFSWLAISRIFIGIALGISSAIVPLYISEISPAPIRGRLVSLNQLAITIGILVSYCVDYAFAYSENWRWMIGLGAFPSFIFGIGMLFLPESPRWLIKKGLETEAKRILHILHGKKEAEREIQEIRQVSAGSNTNAFVFTPWVKRMLVVGIGLAIFQQATGINTIIYYAPIIFELAGFKSAVGAVFATSIIGAVNLIATLFALKLLDTLGRRILLLIGLAGMIFSLFALGLASSIPHVSEMLGEITLACLIVYVCSFAISLGPIFWLLISEIYPLEIRGKAMSIATITNWLTNFIVAFTFLTLIHSLGQARTFWLYGLISIVAWFFCYFLVPETKIKHWKKSKCRKSSSNKRFTLLCE
ncbi:sugar porter family MFS transporter [Parachlamydia acanthamoebae]|uniref:sugar porter family MFS transporter n=1 Tax=Parachlamydia acanthamoebae TaxID=83552 RepID=UPI00057EAA5C|nr:sugar porter family MFS transporter [Parachlamydia acanthamoebae]